MDLNTFIIIIYCLVDDWLKTQPKYRQRGPQPSLSDSELLTIEVVGSFLGHDTDKGLFLYFQRHYSHWFPAVGDILFIHSKFWTLSEILGKITDP